MNTNYLILLFFLFTFTACNDSDEGSKGESNLLIDVADIDSFNKETGEITFKNMSAEEINKCWKQSSTLAFYIDGSTILESVSLLAVSSSFVHNDLVLVMDGTNLFLLDGYPSLDVLGSNKSEAEQLRKENSNKRSANWNKFIDYLQDTGKIIEPSTTVVKSRFMQD